MGIEWFSGEGPETIVIRANRGLLVSSDGGATFRFLCREALGISESEAAPMGFTTDGRLLVATFSEAVLGSSADFCTWSPGPAPVAARQGTHMAVSPAAPGTFYLLTGDQDTTENFFVSANDGADWAPLGATSDIFTRVAVAPSDPQRIYRSGVANSVDAGYPPIISVSTDAGGTWNDYPIPAALEEIQLRVVGVHPSVPDRVFVRSVATSTGLPERLLLSTTGGTDFALVLTAPDLLAFASSSDGTVWAGSSEGLYRSTDGGDTFALVPSSGLTRITCLEVHGAKLYACGLKDNLLGISVSSDGGDTFEPFLRFSGVRDRLDCPADSQGGTTCDVAFAEWQREVVPPAPAPDAAVPTQPSQDAGSPPPPERPDGSVAPPDGSPAPRPQSAEESGCGCRVSGATPSRRALLLGAVVGLLAARRRRRRPDMPMATPRRARAEHKRAQSG